MANNNLVVTRRRTSLRTWPRR